MITTIDREKVKAALEAEAARYDAMDNDSYRDEAFAVRAMIAKIDAIPAESPPASWGRADGDAWQAIETSIADCFLAGIRNGKGETLNLELVGDCLRARIRDYAASLSRAPGGVDLDSLQADVLAWATETFSAATLESTFTHLHRELDEIKAAPSDAVEWADMFLILLHASARWGNLSVSRMVTTAVAKLKINKTRQWGEPDADGVVEHVRDAKALGAEADRG